MKEFELVDEQVTVYLDDERQLVAPLLVGADGAHSKVRQLAAFETREWNYDHNAIVTTVRTEKSHAYTAWQRFLKTGPLAFLPLHCESNGAMDSHYSSIVWSVETDVAKQLMALDDQAFCNRLGKDFEYQLGNVVHAAKRYSFPLRQRHATDYVQPHIALIGDAAHTIHPLAGQGVNLGLLDVVALTQEIVRAKNRQLPLSEFATLRRYQRARAGNNLGMMMAMEGFKRLFGARDLTLRWLRNVGLNQVNNLPALKNLMIKQAMGL